jgi:RHS repeat-associated protein
VVASGDGKSIQWEGEFFPFGLQRTVITNLADNPYQFTGYEYDSGTGYNYAVARFDAGRWGRFLSPDPYLGSIDITNPQSVNRYGYANNNPLNLVDPLGLDTMYFLAGGCIYSYQSNATITENGRNANVDVSAGANTLVFCEGGGSGGGSGGGGGSSFTLGIRAPGQTFRNCMAANAGSYGIAGSTELVFNVATKTNTSLSENIAVDAVAGNDITTLFFGEGANMAAAAGAHAPHIVLSGMGSVTTYGRNTSEIIALNLSRKGGLPLALSPATGGIKSALGKAGKFLGLGLEAATKFAIDLGFTGAEAINCSIPAD